MRTAVARVEFSSLFVCFMFFCTTSQTDAARITQLDVELFREESWKTVYSGVRKSRSRVTKALPVRSLHSRECWLLLVLPAKAREYVFTGVSLCVCVSVCDHDN